MFTEEVNKVALRSNDHKECNQLISEKHAYGTSKDLVSEKEDIKCNSIIK